MAYVRAAHEALAAGIHEAGVMLPPHSTRPTSIASSSRLSDLLASHRQPADIGNGFYRAVWPDPVGHDDGEQQETSASLGWKRGARGKAVSNSR